MSTRGFSLLELLLSLALSLLVLSAAFALLTGILRSAADVQRVSRLDAEMQTLSALLTADLRRAAYREGGGSAAASSFGLTLPGAECVLYSYDRYPDGLLAANEHFGFKRQVVDGIGVLRMRRSGSDLASCHDGSWETLSDPAVVDIAQLVFTPLLSHCLDPRTAEQGDCAALQARAAGAVLGWYRIRVAMVAYARGSPRLARQLQTSVLLRAPLPLLP